MGIFDRFRSKPVRKASALERMVSDDGRRLEKEAKRFEESFWRDKA